MTIVTPYLSKAAELAVSDYVKSKRQPCFLKAVDLNPNYTGYCPNCAGLGVTIIEYAEAGPFHEPPTTRKVITWYEGDGYTKQGWYIIGKTEEFPCQECKGEARVAVAPPAEPIDEARKWHKPQPLSRELTRAKVEA